MDFELEFLETTLKMLEMWKTRVLKSIENHNEKKTVMSEVTHPLSAELILGLNSLKASKLPKKVKKWVDFIDKHLLTESDVASLKKSKYCQVLLSHLQCLVENEDDNSKYVYLLNLIK
jgi:hypothetical protein